jgi:hypothetical protein
MLGDLDIDLKMPSPPSSVPESSDSSESSESSSSEDSDSSSGDADEDIEAPEDALITTLATQRYLATRINFLTTGAGGVGRGDAVLLVAERGNTL